MKKKLVASLLIAVLVIGIAPIGVSSEWKENDFGGWYYMDGNSKATDWKLIDEKWYYFDEYGNMYANCYAGTYYLNGTGAWTHLDYSTSNYKFNEFLKRLNEIEKNDSISSQKAISTADMVMYSKKFNPQYDTLLNDIYNYLKETMPENEFKKLQNEEMEWINKKEVAMNSSLEEHDGGSITAYIAGITSLGYTHDRIYELLKYIN